MKQQNFNTMNWTKLNNDYPLAYKYMEENFNCLYTEHSGIALMCNPPINVKVKHPRKRDLFDFFDEAEIFIETWRTDGVFSGYVNSVDAGDCKSRSTCEEKAFIKAFELLEARLKKQAELPVI